MNYSKFQNRNIPEYYNWMHLDGYTPQEILYACHKKMLKDYDDRIAAGEEAHDQAPPTAGRQNIRNNDCHIFRRRADHAGRLGNIIQ